MEANKIKGFLKDSVLYGTGAAAGQMVGLIMMPILSRIFVPADYGSIDLLTVSYSFLLLGGTLNVTTGVQKKYYEAEGDDLKKMLSSAFFFLFIISSVISIILINSSTMLGVLALNDKSAALAICILALCLPVEMILNCLILLLRLQRKSLLFSAVNIARVILTPVATFFTVVICHLGIQGVFIAQLLSITIVTSVLFFLLRQHFSTTITIKPFFMLLHYSLPGHLGILAKQAMNLLPRFLLASFSSLTAVGLFGVAFRISQSMSLFNNAFNSAWNPFAFANAGKQDEQHLYAVIFKLYAFALIILATTISLFAKELLIILTPVEYHQASYLVGGVVLYLAMQGLSIIFSTALYAQNQVAKVSWLDTMQLVLFLTIAFILVPRFEAAGLILAMNVSMAIHFAVYMKIVFRYFPFPVPGMRLLLLLTTGGATVALYSLIKQPLWVAIASKAVAVALLTTGGFFLLLSTTERQKSLQHCCAYFRRR